VSTLPRSPSTAFVVNWRCAFYSLAFLVCLMAAMATGVPEEPPTKETMTFLTKSPADADGRRRIKIKATLYMPHGHSLPIAAVVIAPSSGGVEEEREIYYANELARMGIGTLIVDSFTSRGFTTSLYDQSAFTEWDMELDAFAALERLAGDKRFRSDRIAIMGVSKGGTVAMNTALSIRREWAGMQTDKFAAHIAISPDCTWITQNPGNTGAPVLFMLAELDDQTPPKPCLQQADRMRQARNTRIETRVYEGAHHAWEELGASPEYDRRVENYSKCRVWVEDSGEMFSANTGEPIPEADWHGWARKNCMTLGATCCGGTSTLKAAATRDVIAFLRKHGF
jgi:dienelactone hydrolase